MSRIQTSATATCLASKQTSPKLEFIQDDYDVNARVGHKRKTTPIFSTWTKGLFI